MTRPQSYKEIFELRGTRYDKAMQLHPEARASEFKELASRLPTAPDFRILDMPSGGGYLSPYFPSNTNLIALDSCPTFVNVNSRHKAIIGSSGQLPFRSACFDGLVSLAGLHHETNKIGIFKEVHRVLKNGAHFCIADVHASSNVALFLDTIVDKYNSLGHQGVYLNNSTLDELSQVGLQITNAELVNFHWVFANSEELVAFCRELFGLDNIEPERFLKETVDILGVTQLKKGIGLNWQLIYISGYAD